MPIHNWSRVEPGIFHDFHQAWSIAIRDALNAGGLPPDYFAMVDQYTGGEYPDVVALQRKSKGSSRPTGSGVAVAEAPPRARFVTSAEIDPYVRRANRIVVKHPAGDVVAVIELVSPGNKGSRAAWRTFVEKSVELLRRGIHLLIVDLFPPTPRDPQGVHKSIWDEIVEEPFELPADKPLTIAAYSAGPPPTAYVEPVAVGDELPSGLPIFLSSRDYVPAPLESTYQSTWAKCPEPLKELVIAGRSEPDA
jgi:hypothetical protein